MINIFKDSDKRICGICQDPIELEASTYKLNCHHEYHQICLTPWLNNHTTCPLDRGIITSINGSAFEIERIRKIQQRMQAPAQIDALSNVDHRPILPLIGRLFENRDNRAAEDQALVCFILDMCLSFT